MPRTYRACLIGCGRMGAPEKQRGICPSRAPRANGGQTPLAGRGTRPASGAHRGINPSPCGKGPKGVESTPREYRAKAPEGSHNQSESTLALPSDCPTKEDHIPPSSSHS